MAAAAAAPPNEPPPVCSKHGVVKVFQAFDDNLITPGRWYCPECDAQNERRLAEEAARQKAERLIRCIPYHYQGAALSDFDAAEIGQVLKWASAPEGFVYVTGECGTGKTHLACAVQKKLNADGRDSTLAFSAEMFLQLHKSFGRNSEVAEDRIINRYAPENGGGIIILDDVGAQKISDYTVDAWYKIIDRRYRLGCPTMITTNLSPKELTEVLGDRTTSRILSGVRLRLTGPDRRIKAHWTEKFD